jgi:hypothetical protein
MQRPDGFATEIVRKVLAFKRPEAELESYPDEQAGEKQRYEESAERVEKPARRPYQRLVTTPP